MVFLALLNKLAKPISKVFDSHKANFKGLIDITGLQDFRARIIGYEATTRIL